MKANASIRTSKTGSRERKGDASKLVSLLALASGAVAIPQTGNADIIYTNLTSAPVKVGFTGGEEFVINIQPEDATLRFYRTPSTLVRLSGSHIVRVAGSAHGYAKVKLNTAGFAAVAPTGLVWSQIGRSTTGGADMGASTVFHTPSSEPYNDQYLAFRFADASNQGRLTYGWVHVSLSFTLNGPDVRPDVTIYGYAFDDQGNQIRMGATSVPEPASTTLLALGALTLGAAGVRRWRRDRAAAGQL